MTIDTLLDDIIAREGGFVDHSADKGGPTKYGITQNTLSEWRGHAVGVDEVMALTEGEARQIYEKLYWLNPKLYKLHDEVLQAILMDMAVNHGPTRAIKILQKLVGVKEDGIFGPRTSEAVQKLPAKALAVKVLAERFRFYGRIITKDPSQAVFAAGWMNRSADIMEKALV